MVTSQAFHKFEQLAARYHLAADARLAFVKLFVPDRCAVPDTRCSQHSAPRCRAQCTPASRCMPSIVACLAARAAGVVFVSNLFTWK